MTRPPAPVFGLLLALLYWGAVQLGLALRVPMLSIAVFWPAAGVGLGGLLLAATLDAATRRRAHPPRRGPGPHVLAATTAVVLANLGGNLLGGNDIARTAGFTLANTVEPLVGMLVLQALEARRSRRAGALGVGSRVGGLRRFFLAAVTGVTAGSVVAVFTLRSFVPEPDWLLAINWAVPDLVGALLVAPVLLLPVSGNRTARPASGGRAATAQSVLSGAALLLATAIACSAPWHLPIGWVSLPFLVWTAARGRPTTVVGALVLVGTSTTLSSRFGVGSFDGGGTDPTHLFAAQLYVITAALLTFGTAAVAGDLREAHQYLRDQEEDLRLAVDEAVVAWLSVATDTRGTVVGANRSARTLLGDQGLDGGSWRDLVAPVDREVWHDALQTLLDGSARSWTGELRHLRPDGVPFVAEVSAAVTRNRRADRRLSVQVLDVDEKRRAEARLRALAMHDPLTGLANRLMFAEVAREALGRARERSLLTGVLYADLDGFKQVNDRSGHRAGDLLLVAVSERLRNVVRQDDTVARLGGDEFVVVCPFVRSPDEVGVIAERIVRALSRPFHVEGIPVGLSVSVGITLGHGHENIEDLVREADAAMYRAKQGGRNRYETASTLR